MAQRAESKPLAAAMSVELVHLGGEAGHMNVYGWRNMTFVVWTGSASAENVGLLDEISAKVRDQHPEGLSGVHIVRGGTPLPSSQAREALVRLANAYANDLAAVGVVIGGSGFWASTMRSVVTAMRVLASRAYEMRIHGTVDEIVDWLPAVHAKRTGVTLDPAELLQALRHAAELAQ